jgi:hypothetical protein
MGTAAHVLAVNPVPARSQMGSSLAFHIILACFGVAFAAVTMTAEFIGIRRGDAAALLARRWGTCRAPNPLWRLGGGGCCCRIADHLGWIYDAIEIVRADVSGGQGRLPQSCSVIAGFVGDGRGLVIADHR